MELYRAPLLVRKVEVDQSSAELDREWIVTNGLGGYASSTIASINTRRFHGWLIAALPAPLGRTMMLNKIEETLRLNDTVSPFLKSFRLENGLPVFTYAADEFTLEKRLCMAHRQNTTYITYRLLKGKAVRLELRPGVDVRPHEGPLSGLLHENYRFSAGSEGYEIWVADDIPALRLKWLGEDASFHLALTEIQGLQYRSEQSRGYDWSGNLWSPGSFSVTLSAGDSISLVASTEPWDQVNAMSPERAFAAEAERRRRLLRSAPEEARSGIAAELVFAADQ